LKTSPDRKKPLVALIVVFAAVVGLDQGTKRWAHHGLLGDGFHERSDEYPVCGTAEQERARERFGRRYRRNEVVIDGCFELRYVENCASAFGLMGRVPESLRYPFFIVVSLLAAAFIPYLYRKTPVDQKLMLWALPFVLGGAVGNLVDRLFFRYVIDFVRWYVVIDEIPRDWPTFNVADAAIVAGIGLMLLQMIPRRSKEAIEEAK